ncbi:hypothetical protein LEG54_11095 [Salmonella enterica]|nr:hypothetical protein [Salmonella enterica]MCQ7735317.1 hypothetical protein [Salmonella enterica]MCQ7739629.1 hypothetical protein [Salmonella enterica]MDJ9089319.1 hypothetical protein [Salmonella enterica]
MTTNNHPAHGPVSLERLHQIREILSKAAAQSDGGNLGYAMADAVKVIDGAIAAMNANPVAWLHSDNGIGIPAITRSRNVADSWFSKGWNIKPLYTTPPATVVPDEMTPVQASRTYGDEVRGYRDGWNACRAAMLQSFGNPEQLEPLSHGEKLPMDYLQGHKDGLEWAAQLAEANHPQTGDWLYDDPIELARAIRKGPDMPPVQTGNSPATPDCWVMVPKRLTAENGAKGVLSGEFSETKFINCPECFGDDDCETCDGSGRIEITVPVTWTTIKAIWAKGVEHFAAAPQQEVKP